MLIDVTSCPKFGSLTQGNGLSGAFDGSNATVSYTNTTTGYIGVSLISPSCVEFVEVVSADNGFDASGMMSSINIQLYGKVGTPPSHATDGKLLTNMNLIDQNLLQVITLESSDKTTTFDHLWVRLSTGVWSIVSEIRFYRPSEPEKVSSGSQVFLSSCNQKVMLTQGGVEVSQFRIPLLLDSPRKLLLDFHGDVTHVGTGTAGTYAVGFSWRLCYRSADTVEALQTATFSEIPNAVGGGNVSERNPQHYGNKSICSYLDLPAGVHELSVIASGHTDATTAQLLQILVEGGKGLNCLRVTVLP